MKMLPVAFMTLIALYAVGIVVWYIRSTVAHKRRMAQFDKKMEEANEYFNALRRGPVMYSLEHNSEKEIIRKHIIDMLDDATLDELRGIYAELCEQQSVLWDI